MQSERRSWIVILNEVRKKSWIVILNEVKNLIFSSYGTKQSTEYVSDERKLALVRAE